MKLFAGTGGFAGEAMLAGEDRLCRVVVLGYKDHQSDCSVCSDFRVLMEMEATAQHH